MVRLGIKKAIIEAIIFVLGSVRYTQIIPGILAQAVAVLLACIAVLWLIPSDALSSFIGGLLPRVLAFFGVQGVHVSYDWSDFVRVTLAAFGFIAVGMELIELLWSSLKQKQIRILTTARVLKWSLLNATICYGLFVLAYFVRGLSDGLLVIFIFYALTITLTLYAITIQFLFEKIAGAVRAMT